MLAKAILREYNYRSQKPLTENSLYEYIGLNLLRFDYNLFDF
jgi:hypothetical protein